jgi:hypothetical protein
MITKTVDQLIDYLEKFRGLACLEKFNRECAEGAFYAAQIACIEWMNEKFPVGVAGDQAPPFVPPWPGATEPTDA